MIVRKIKINKSNKKKPWKLEQVQNMTPEKFISSQKNDPNFELFTWSVNNSVIDVVVITLVQQSIKTY